MMNRGRQFREEDNFMSPITTTQARRVQSKMYNIDRENKRSQRSIIDEFQPDCGHTIEGNMSNLSMHSSASIHSQPYRPASERSFHESVHSSFHSDSLNLSDMDKLYSGVYPLDSSTRISCESRVDRPDLLRSFARSPLHDDWPTPYAGASLTSNHGSSSSPIGDGNFNAFSRSHLRGTSPASNLYSNQMRNFDTVKKIADDIIREKDTIIESQRIKVEELESYLKTNPHNWSQDKESLLRDYEKENQSLRKQLYNNSNNGSFHHNSTSLATSSVALEEQLCALEYNLNEVKKSSDKNLLLKDYKITELLKELSDKREEVERCEKKLHDKDSELEKVRSEVEKMLGYMGGLPPLEEHNNNLKKIVELEASLQESEKVAQERWSLLKDRSKVIKLKDSEVERLKDEVDQVRKCLQQTQSENTSLNEEISRSCDLIDKRKLREDNNNMHREMETQRKVYDAKVKQLQVKLLDEEKRKDLMKESMSEMEMTNDSLKRDVATYKSCTENLEMKIREVTHESESLRSELERVKNERKFLQGLRSEQEYMMFKQLMSDFDSAFQELQAIIKICKEKAENKEPNLDDLLGTKSLTNKINQDDLEGDMTMEEMLHSKNLQLIELRRDIDFLRGELADLVAEDLGRRLTCSLQ